MVIIAKSRRQQRLHLGGLQETRQLLTATLCEEDRVRVG